MNDLSCKYVIVGSGIAGLFAAYLTKRKFPNDRVIILEREANFGGLLGSFNDKEWGDFDHGTHMIFETFDKEIDEFLFLPFNKSDYNELEGDWAGTYWNQTLSLQSSQLDLRTLPNIELNEIQSYVENNYQEPINETSAGQYLKERFGNLCYEKVFSPILKKLFPVEPEHLSQDSIKVFPFSRLILFSEHETLKKMDSINFRSKVGFPDQFSLPKNFRSNRKGFYPRKVGLHKYIQDLIVQLKNEGIEFLQSCRVEKISQLSDELEIEVKTHQSFKIRNINKLIWSAGVPNLYFSRLLPVEISQSLNRGFATFLVDVVVDSKTDLKVHYIYDYAPNHLTYRITNYRSFTQSDINDNYHKYTLELLCDENSIHSINEKIALELKELGIIKTAEQIKFLNIRPIQQGIPLITFENQNSLRKIRSDLSFSSFSNNIVLVGAAASEGIFFQSEILRDTFNKINSLV